MASASQLLVVRLQSGGTVVLAPAVVLPWPKVLGRKQKSLQDFGIHQLMADPPAVRRLRSELPYMLDRPILRGEQPDSAGALVRELRAGVSRGELTLIYGHAEPSLGEGRSADARATGDVEKVDSGRNAVRLRQGVDGADKLPPHGTAVPHELEKRMLWICERAPYHLSRDDALEFREFFGTGQSEVTAKLLRLWADSQGTGAGFTVDANMFAIAAGEIGSDANHAFDTLADAFKLARFARDWPTLDSAATKLGVAAVKFRRTLFRQLLRRVGSRVASMSVG